MIRRYVYKGLGIVSPFCVWFLKKNIFFEILSNTCITIVCFSRFDVISFEIKLIFQPKLFFYMTKKSRQKYKYIENKKSFYLRVNKKDCSSFLKNFQLPNIVSNLRKHLQVKKSSRYHRGDGGRARKQSDPIRKTLDILNEINDILMDMYQIWWLLSSGKEVNLWRRYLFWTLWFW